MLNIQALFDVNTCNFVIKLFPILLRSYILNSPLPMYYDVMINNNILIETWITFHFCLRYVSIKVSASFAEGAHTYISIIKLCFVILLLKRSVIDNLLYFDLRPIKVFVWHMPATRECKKPAYISKRNARSSHYWQNGSPSGFWF